MLNLEKSIILDPHMIEVVGWLLLFLFTSLVGIIVWLAKGVWDKLQIVSNKQDVNYNAMSTMQSHMSHMRNDLDSMSSEMEDVPKILTKTVLLESIVVDIKADMVSIKRDHLEYNKRLQQVEMDTALHKQWIQLRGDRE